MIISINGFLIHSQRYKETSSIIYIFSPTRGLQSLLFKGKDNNKEKFKFSIFNEYQFSFNDKYNFPFLSKFETIAEYKFDKKYYLLGLYINELLYKILRHGYDFEKIYHDYKSFLIHLSSSSDSSKLLALFFEKKLLENLGYGLNVYSEDEINDYNYYYYDFDYGFKIVDGSQRKFSIKGKYLKDFFSHKFINENEINYLRAIVKEVLNNAYPQMILNGDKLF